MWGRRIAQGVLAVGLLAPLGCRPAPPPSAQPPFRVAAVGPGLEVESGGRKMDIVGRDGALVARYRVHSSGIRIYGADATRFGRLVVAAEGFDLVKVDGTRLCSVLIGDDVARFSCGERSVVLEREDTSRMPLSVDDSVLGVLEETSEGWRFEYAGRSPGATVQFEDGRLSVRTHDDARAWYDTQPTTWHPAALVISRVMLPEFTVGELDLVRGALAFAVADWFDADLSLRTE